MAHTELSLRERRTIEDMLHAKFAVDKTAAAIGRHRATTLEIPLSSTQQEARFGYGAQVFQWAWAVLLSRHRPAAVGQIRIFSTMTPSNARISRSNTAADSRRARASPAGIAARMTRNAPVLMTSPCRVRMP